MRLGFSVAVYGCPNLPSHDVRRDRPWPHLSVSLAYLRDLLCYLRDNDLHMYRMHSGLAPHVADPEAPDVSAQIAECALELTMLGDMARQNDIRLSFHPYSIVTLDALNEDQVLRSAAYLQSQTAMLDAMQLGPEATIVVHVGGVYDNLAASCERFVHRYERLPEAVQQRLALENDDHRFSHADVWAIHQQCGVRLVFDNLHHLVHNPAHVPMRQALEQSLATWSAEVTPKVHFSTPRTEARSFENTTRLKMPTWTEHSDFCSPFEFIAFMRLTEGLRAFDVMLESKARDVALLKLREDLRRFAPDMARTIR
jgi:UV DNA damage endonuclease